MTWQGAGGAEGGPGDPDDATRTDWAVGGQAEPEPSPLPPDATTPLPPAAPPASAPPDPALVPPAAPPVQQPAPSPWAPPSTGAWGAQPDGGRYAVPGAPGLIYAGAIPRSAAWIVDSFILGIVAAIVSLPFASPTTLPADTGLPFDTTTMLARTGISSVVTLAVSAVYFIGLWLTGGRATLGMRLFSLQVGNIADGSKLEPVQAVKRWLGYGSFVGLAALAASLAPLVAIVQLIWTIVLLATTASSPTKQGLHDRFAGSAVVRPASAGNGLALTCLVVALVIPILAVFSLLALVFLGGQVSSILSAVGDSV
jgi:uncharacterized RDD family membrane protein YckC